MVVFAQLWSSASLAALNFLLHSFQVNTSSVSATLRITNSTDEDVVLTFPSAGTFDLMVDGNVTTIVYPDILTELTIPAHEFVNSLYHMLVQCFHQWQPSRSSAIRVAR
jgi:hypothetical protein